MGFRQRKKPFGIEKPKRPGGEIVIMETRCKGCGFCVEYCPNDVLRLSDKYNEKGYHPPEIINADACGYCGFCQMLCPEFGIFIVREDEESKEENKD